ncbi:hypothetical protein SEUCBS139899_000666 [Sporothrix eucalyptigena]|uniref:Uncharacterized protein n=1 Tax=Sporothrix eucalyptigena TaxID=1812306 RepID=A0ABP0CN84_9PEZI
MAGYAAQTTPPTTADRKKDTILGRQHPLAMNPSPWAEPPPTPQDSLASPCQTPPTSPSLHLAEPVSPSPAMLEEDDNILMHDSGTAAQTARLRRSTPTLITIGPKVGRENRMQHWLSEIPPPVSPQERYIQGLNPAVDHPLHPRPLRAVAPRQARYLSSTEITGDDSLSVECEKLAIDVSDKENAMIRNRLKALETAHASSNAPVTETGLGTKKRHMAEDSTEGVLARKRTRLLDPVRRFSQRLSSSLALSGSEDERRDSQSEDLSPEDLAKQSEMLYRFGGLSKTPSSSLRSSFSRRTNSTFRSQSSGTIRRIMSSKLAPPMTPPSGDGQVGFWTEGRPDMIVNVAFIGDARVGKTALIKRLVYGTFPQTYSPSSIQEHTVRLVIDGARVQLNLSEGGSGRDPREPSILALGWFSVVVLCYDVGHYSSLESLHKYRNDIAIYEENSVVILAGLKKDARRRLPPLQLTFMEDSVQVSPDKGKEAARKLGCADYFECSSLSSCEGIDDLFDYVVQSGVEFQKNRNKTMSRFRFERSVDKGMTKIAEGVRSLFTFHGSAV